MENEKNFDGFEVASLIFRCVYNTKQHFGINYIASILIGSKSQKISKYTHDQLEQYGSLKAYSFGQVKLFIQDLLEQEYLFQTKGEYPVIYLMEKAKKVLAGSEEVVLKEPDPELARKMSSQKGESAAKTLELYKAGKNVLEIAEERKIAPATVMSHLAIAYEQGEQINIDQFVPTEKQEIISKAFQKFGTDYLSPVKQSIGVSVSWEDLKWVRAKLVRQQMGA